MNATTQLIAALNQNADDERELFNAYKGALATAETQKAVLVLANQESAAALAAAVAEKMAAITDRDSAVAAAAAVQALYDKAAEDLAALVEKTDAIENDARAGLPGVPPIDTPTEPAPPSEPPVIVDPEPTTPTDPVVVGMLLNDYESADAFKSAVAAYGGAEGVDLDNVEVKASTDDELPRAKYYTNEDGTVDTTPNA